jgi:uncharacterized membrane protein
MANKQPFHKILMSVLAALFGIQSAKKASDDFEESSPWVFILIGIFLIILLVIGLLTIVMKVAP